jgi:predicted ATPase/transcriptional regulator with XRE-family HTH domain
MSPSEPALSLDSFTTFGDLLKYSRRRARLTQREVAIAVGYSEAQISRLEQNLRPPDLAALAALFIPALYLEDEPEIVARLMELAAQARGEELPRSGVITFSHSVQQETLEEVRSVEDNVLNNLPLPLTSFVGRQREIVEIKDLLGKAKLVTLTGSGGCGKTRLAIEAAKRLIPSYRDGIWLIELASITDPALVVQTVASNLGVPESHDVRRMLALTKYLRTRQILLILDNCEQIVPAMAQLAEEILRTCPHVQVLVTSREILGLTGEVQFRVPSLPLSKEKASDSDMSSPSEAVQLFVERAQAALPSFVLTDDVIPAVTEICHLVDGLPLGIELAGANVNVLSVEQIAARLKNSLQLLGSGRATLPHHQTIEATIEWSYDLLSEAEQILLQRLSVFSGGWTLEAAESVVSDPARVHTKKVFELISQLVNKSLVVVEWQSRAEAHFRMLQTIREFASRKLRAAGGTERLRSRHFDYFLSLAQQARLFGDEKGSWLDRLEAEHDNLRSALTYSLEAGAIEKGAALILPILDFYWFRGYATEAREWMGKFLEIEAPPSRQRALLLQKAGWLTRASGDFERADALLTRALAMALEIDDKNRAAWALMDLGLCARDQGNHEHALSLFARALTFAQESMEPRAVGVSLYNLADSAALTGDLATSRMYWEEALEIFRAEGDQTHISWGLEGMAGSAYLAKDYAGALMFHLESLKIKVGVMDKLGIAYSLEGLAQVAAAEEEAERAAILWGAANRLREALNIPIESSRAEIYTSLMPITRNQIGEEAFDQAWKRGKAMTLNEAIDYALLVRQ